MSEGVSHVNNASIAEKASSPAGAASFAVALFVGLAAGTLAQYLRQEGGVLASLGGATAPWVTGGYLLSLWVARKRAAVEGLVWAAAVLAAYLLSWLLSYHTEYAIRESVSGSMAWNDARTFVAAVTPICVVLGAIAAYSHREGILGDICLSLPLAWSLPEAYRAIERGWTYAILVALPTLGVAVVPFIIVRAKKANVNVIAVSAVIYGLLFYLLYQPLSDYFNRV